MCFNPYIVLLQAKIVESMFETVVVEPEASYCMYLTGRESTFMSTNE